MPDNTISLSAADWMNEITEGQGRIEPTEVSVTDILQSGSYLFYDFKDREEVFQDNSAQRYTKAVSPLFSKDIIDSTNYWSLLKIITDDIPFYYLEPTVEQTVNEQPMSTTNHGVNLSETLALADYRDAGTVDVPNALQGSDFWSSWLRDTLGYYRNKLILDVYNKLQFPYLNEHHYLNAGLFPVLAAAADNEQSELLDFKSDTVLSAATSLDHVGVPAYLNELINQKLQSVYALLDYNPDSAEILSEWLDSLYQTGVISAENLEKERAVYQLQDIKYELLKRKFAGTSTLYSIILKSINKTGSYISTVPASTVGNSRATYAIFNEKRSIRLVSLPGISSSSLTDSDLPFDPIYEFYTRPVEEKSGREIPLNTLYPLYYSAANTWQVTYKATPVEDGVVISSENYRDILNLISANIFGPVAFPLRSASDNIVWDALTGLSVSQSLTTVYTTLDEKIYTESEEGIDPEAIIHLDPVTTRDSSGEVVTVLHTLDEQIPYASLSDVTGHMLDISANALMYHKNTFQQKQGSNYEYLTYPITNNTSVSLMDTPWTAYLKYTTDRKSRIEEETSVGVQLSAYNQLSNPRTVDYPVFFLSNSCIDSGSTVSPAYSEESSDVWYLWFMNLRYEAERLRLTESQSLPTLVSKIYLAQNLKSLSEEEKESFPEELRQYHVGLLPLTYPDLSSYTVSGLKYSYDSLAGHMVDDFADYGYTKGYFVFSAWDNLPGKQVQATSAQPAFLDQDPAINEDGGFSAINISGQISDFLELQPDFNSTKTVYFVLKKKNLEWQETLAEYGEDSSALDGIPEYLYTWSDPIPVLTFTPQVAELYDQLFVENPQPYPYYPDWWNLSYYLNPYLNFTQNSASPLRHKLALTDYASRTVQQTIEGPSQITGLSNLARMRHMSFVCTDNGLPTIYTTSSEYPDGLNTLLNLQVTNPFTTVNPTADNEAHALQGVYLDHEYWVRPSGFDDPENVPANDQTILDMIKGYPTIEKQLVQELVAISGDNRDLHPLDSENTLTFTKIAESATGVPSLHFEMPAAIPTDSVKTQLLETVTLRPAHREYSQMSMDWIDPTTGTSEDKHQSWIWSPFASASLIPVSYQTSGFTVCLNCQFRFSINPATAYLPSELYTGSITEDFSLADRDQVLLRQPGLFILKYITGQEGGYIQFSLESQPSPVSLACTQKIVEGHPYRITIGYNQLQQEAYLLVDNEWISKSFSVTAQSLPQIDQHIRIGYDYDYYTPVTGDQVSNPVLAWGNQTFKVKDLFYGDIYDLRLYPIGFWGLNLMTLNRGSLFEQYSYAPSTYKLAYSIYNDLNILKTVALTADDWSVRKVRVFQRSVWDSILPDMYPVSQMESNQGSWQYISDYYNPKNDPDIYKSVLTLPLDLTEAQAKQLADTTSLEDRTTLLTSWNLASDKLTPSALESIAEYNFCIEQTLKKNAEVINSSSPLNYEDDNDYAVLTYRGIQHEIHAQDTVSIINTTLYPVQYQDWPYISFNPEDNKTPVLKFDTTTGAITTEEKRGFYLPVSVRSVDDNITYSVDLDINFKVNPAFSAVRAYSFGGNVAYQFNEDLQATTAYLKSQDASSSNNNHILMGMAVPRQKNISSESLGSLETFELQNFTLSSAFKQFLIAKNYYTELLVPVPYTSADNQSYQFAYRWHALRTLKEGSYFFTCKYPMQILPFLDQDYDSLADQSHFTTVYATVRFKVEVTGSPVEYDPEELPARYQIPAVPVAGKLQSSVKKYDSTALRRSLTDSQALYYPEDNRSFPHRQMTIRLWVQDFLSGGDSTSPEAYKWTLLGSNDPTDLKQSSIKQLGVIPLTKATLEKPELAVSVKIPMFLQKNFRMPFFCAKVTDGTADPTTPFADSLYYSLDPMGNSASWDKLTLSSEDDYSSLRLIAGKAYKVLFDYNGRVTEMSFSEGSSFGESLAEESVKYSQTVNLLSSSASVLSATANPAEYSYQRPGQAFRTVSDWEFQNAGYKTEANGFSAIGALSEQSGYFAAGDPYSEIRTKNYKLQIMNDSETALTDITQAYTFPYIIEGYPASKSDIYTLRPLSSIPVIENTQSLTKLTYLTLNEQDILSTQHNTLMAICNQAISQLSTSAQGILSQISVFIPDFGYSTALYAKYSYIKSSNENLLGYKAKDRNIMINALPFKLSRSSLYTENLFRTRNLLDSAYWTKSFSASADTPFLFAQTVTLVSDQNWKSGKDVLNWDINIGCLLTEDGEDLSEQQFSVTDRLEYRPYSTKAISDPVEVFIALSQENLQSSGKRKLAVSVELISKDQVVQTVELTPGETELYPGYLEFKADITPVASFDRLAYTLAYQNLTVGDLTPDSETTEDTFQSYLPLRIKIGKVSIRKYLKDVRQSVGLSDVILRSNTVDANSAVHISSHDIVLFKNKFNDLLVTPLQFRTQEQQMTLDDSAKTVITRPVVGSTVSATEFIRNYWVRPLSKTSPYTLLAKPWLRRLILSHQYIPLQRADLLGTAFGPEQFDGYDQPIRCSSTQAAIETYVIDLDAYGNRYLRQTQSKADQLYVFKQSSSGDGVVFIDSEGTTEETTTSYFKLASAGDVSEQTAYGLFLNRQSGSDVYNLKSFLAGYNTNLEVDDTEVSTAASTSRYAIPSSGVIEDTYGPFSISNEKISLLTSTFNTEDFSSRINQNALQTSDVLVTNVQLLGQGSIITPAGATDQEIILYEYEFLPVIYDEKTQHLSLNYFIHYPVAGGSETETEG